MKHTVSLIAACAIAAGLLPAAAVADRAVIVGVGQYQFDGVRGSGNPYCEGFSICPITDLPGIDRDVRLMQKLVADLGVRPKDVRVLLDDQATLANVQQALQWLLAAGPNERAYFYYSGHGSQVEDENGDEDDGADETLVLTDAVPRDKTMAGMLVDDWLSAQLARTSVKEVTLVIDACHSGTVTKGAGDREGLQRWKRYVSRPVPVRAGASKSAAEDFADRKSGSQGSPYVAFSAVADNQLAPATANGSPFTMALGQVVADARATKATLTPVQLRDGVARRLQQAGYPASEVNPQVNGAPPLLRAAMTLQPSPGALWSKFEQIVANSTAGAVALGETQPRYSVARAEPLNFALDLGADGYVTIVSIDRSDQANVLLPNSWVPELKLTKGRHELPRSVALEGAGRKLEFVPSQPGETFVVAIVTPEKLDLGSATPEKGTGLSLGALDASVAELIRRQLSLGEKQFTAVVREDQQAQSRVTRPQAAGVVLEVVP